MKTYKKFTKNKRFIIIDNHGFNNKQSNEDYSSWKNNLVNEYNNIIKDLTNNGYIEVQNFNGGDNDYLCIDELKKEFIWCEYGFHPFDIYSLNEFENNDNITLEYLYKIRN
jgi:hypothetical protein